MSLKTRTSKFLVIALLLPLSLAYAKDYSDIIKVNEKFLSAMERYVTSLESAQSSPDVASAFDQYTDSVEELLPEMKAMKEKYPELMQMETPPPELQSIASRMEELGGKMAGMMMKIHPYLRDPEVQTAMNRMGQVMSQMQ